MSRQEVRIALPGSEPGELTGLVDHDGGAAPELALLLAHGAGAGIETPLLEALAVGLARRGVPVLRFRYPYMERMAREGKRRPPDRAPALLTAQRVALEHLRGLFPSARPVLAGKSLGGRMASLLVAAGEPVAGLCLIGYPLHPAGKPERLRVEHFPDIRVPTLFLQGTRDRLCELALLERELPRLGVRPQLVLVQDADHDFGLPKRAGRSPEAVQAELVAQIARWLREDGGARGGGPGA